MKPNTGFIKSCLVAVFVVVLIASVAIIVVLFLRGVQNTRKAANIPPSVLVNAPLDGESVYEGSHVLADVAATAQYPLARLEFWLDGELLETHTPDNSLGAVTNFYAIAQLHITEGPHIFFTRAVDANGLIGQSPPILIWGKALPATTEVTTKEGQTLQDIADATGTDKALLEDINPGLGEGALPGGSKVILPAPAGSNQPGGGQPGGSGPGIIPPAPLPVPPSGIVMLPFKPIDIGSLLNIFLSARPKAPTDLKAGYENCTMRLMWMDNADDESYFRVWMQTLGGPPKIIATLSGSPQTGPAWYEFASPSAGIYSFWVEAVNALGGQTSEIAWVGVPDLNCASGVATNLQIEIADMYISGGYDRTYCYLSVENTPEKRIPSKDGQFVPVSNGWGDVSHWTGSSNSFLLPEPQDGEVTLEGTCLGWKGGSGPDNLGIFSASAPTETWDGRRMELNGAGFNIGYSIQYQGKTQANGFYTYADFTFPSPSQPWIAVKTSSDPAENDKLARRPGMLWYWNGDSTKLTSFTIFLDGKQFSSVPSWMGGAPGGWSVKNEWGKELLLPTSCGGVYNFQVAANSGEAQSPPSAIYKYVQPPCKLYAEITFESFTFTYIDDGDPPCDTAQVYYYVHVGNGFEYHNSAVGGSSVYYNMSCGEHLFSDYPATEGYTFVLPLDPQNSTINLFAHFLDSDSDWEIEDWLCRAGKNITMPYQDWATYSQRISENCDISDVYDGYGYITFTVKGVSAPDASRNSNPGIGPPVGP